MEYRLRRSLAEGLPPQHAAGGGISPSDGFRFFAKEEFAGAGAAAERCAELFEAARGERDFEALVSNPKKLFLLSILDGPELLAQPELLRFMVSRPILDVAATYLGTIPRLAGARLWWSPPNDTIHSSQRLHYDFEDSTQLKVFVNVRDVEEDQGPLTFLPASLSARVPMLRGRSARVSDEEALAAVGGTDHLRSVIGPAGSGAFLDTSRCLHLGSRQNRRERLVLMFQFLRLHAPYRTTKPFSVAAGVAGAASLDRVQRLVLGLP